jgi:hypothetical protein
MIFSMEIRDKNKEVFLGTREETVIAEQQS